MDPSGILLGFGVALIVVGAYYKTPFPVQPMKAIGTAAITQTAGAVVLTPAIVAGAGMATGLFWLLLGMGGLAKRLSFTVPAAWRATSGSAPVPGARPSCWVRCC